MPRIPVFIYTADPATGNALPSVTCTVKNRITDTNVSLFSAETGGSSVTNPLTSDSLGRAFAWTERVPLKIDYSGTGITAYTEYRGDGAQPTFESTLPASPYDGQEIYFQNAAMATEGLVWHLRYRSGGGTYKWEGVGAQTPLRAQIDTSQTTATVSYTDLATVGPDITVPLAGEYDVGITFEGANNTAGNYAVASFQVVGGAAASDTNRALAHSSSAGGLYTPSRTTRFTVTAASSVLRMKYLATPAGTATFLRRVITVAPIKVG